MLRWKRDLLVSIPIMSADSYQQICAVCAQVLSSDQFPSKPVDSKCTHEMQTCSQCWKQWLQAQVATKTFDNIQCAQCTGLLTQSEVKALASQEVYQRYLDSELRATLSSDPNFYWCMSGSCSYGQLHFDGDIFTCQACGHKACMTCKAPWHGGETCGDYQARLQEIHDETEGIGKIDLREGVYTRDDEKDLRRRQKSEEAEAAETLSRVSKLCPGCARKVQKNGGCDHIHCTQCNCDFCWTCLVDYQRVWKEGNSAHDTSCPYWRARPR